MKPGFALLLSREGIGLLQRGSDGWLAVDEVSLDDPDLASKLGVLRMNAEALASEAGDPKVLTKLLLPNSEILYEDVVLPQADDVEIEIERHLDGRTPYSVAELNYDYVLSDRLAQVAVVARETLEEAEAFAVEHGFNPVYFCALPPAGSFTGEPMFGLTKAARKLLPLGISVERGMGKCHVTGAVDLPEIPASEPPAEVPTAAAARAEPVPEFRSTRARALESEAANPDTPLAAIPPRLTNRLTTGNFQSSAAASQAMSGAFSDVRHLLRVKPIPTAIAATLALFAVTGWILLSPSGSQIADNEEAGTEASQTALQTPAALEQSVPQLAAVGLQDASAPELVVAELPSQSVSAKLAAVAPMPPVQPSGLSAPVRSAPSELQKISKITGEEPLVTAVVADAPPLPSSATRLAQVASSSPQRPNEPGLPPAISLEAPQASASIEITQELPDTGRLTDDPVSSTEMAALTPPAQTPLIPGGQAAVSDIGGTAPEPPAEADSTDATAELTEPAQDAAAGSNSPTALALADNLDTRPDAGSPPIAPSGLLRPASEPDVVLVPNLDSDQLAQLAEVRPNARPEGLSPPAAIEVVEVDPALARLQTLRPTARPSGLKPPKPTIKVAVNDASEVPLAQRPKKRPSKIRQMAAQTIPQDAPKAQPEKTASAAAIVAPKTKTSYRRETSTVARRATMQNAMVTKQVALIGVYGSDSKRRALVRLPSGRYVKVNVGDRIDGGKVASIGRNSIKYVKGGRSKTLKVPEG